MRPRVPVDWNVRNNRLSEQILQNASLDALLDALGCPLRYRSCGKSAFRMPCPIHEGDGDNLQFTLHGRELPILWACFSGQCHATYKPSLLGFVRGVLSTRKGVKATMAESAAFLEKHVQGMADPLPRPGLKERKPKGFRPIPRDEVRRRLEIPSSYFLGRGFSAEVLDAFDVGTSGRARGVIVPLYAEDGDTCTGFLTRSPHPVCPDCGGHHAEGECDIFSPPRWSLSGGFERSSYLYNHAAATRSDAQHVFLVEGAPDVWRLAEAGHVGVALLGSDASPTQLRMLQALRREVIVAFDSDERGVAAAKRFEELKRREGIDFATRSYGVPSPWKDFGDMDAGDIRRALRDFGVPASRVMPGGDAECPELRSVRRTAACSRPSTRATWRS